jgi:hypothetical protein
MRSGCGRSKHWQKRDSQHRRPKAAREALDIAGEFLRRHLALSTTLREFPINPTQMEKLK